MTDRLSRRALLSAGGAAGATLAFSRGTAAAQQAHLTDPTRQSLGRNAEPADVLFFFNEAEASFVERAIDRLIPPDPEWPGAVWAGVLVYIDRQLASAYGAGGHMYLNGPWAPDAPPEQGYQLRYSPAELYRIGVEETRAWVRDLHGGREFWEIGEPMMDEALHALETGQAPLPPCLLRFSSRRCSRTRSKASSPIRPTAATATPSAGAWSASREPTPSSSIWWTSGATRTTAGRSG
jgi:gluconate 2-dehydrogenase gamma chain